MATKDDLEEWLTQALRAHSGRASIVQVSEYIWDTREKELRGSGDLFYT